MNFIPLITSIIAFIFFLLLIKQYLSRKKIHQLIWTIAILFYALTSLLEFLMNFGTSTISFMVYYFMAAPLVGCLGAGVLYLLTPRRIAHLFLIFVIILSIGLIISGIIIPINEVKLFENFAVDLGTGFSDFDSYYPMNVRIYSVLLNSIGGMILIVGSGYSLIRDKKAIYNIFIGLGGLLPYIGGFAVGFFNIPDVKFLFELGGIIFLLLGFMMSYKYVRKSKP